MVEVDKEEQRVERIAKTQLGHKQEEIDFMERSFIPKLKKALDEQKEKGVDKKTFASNIGTTPNTLNNWLNNVSTPSFLSLIKLSQYLGVSTDYLCGTEEDGKKQKIESTKEFLASIWQQYKYCHNRPLYMSIRDDDVYINTLPNTGYSTDYIEWIQSEYDCDKENAMKIIKMYEDEKINTKKPLSILFANEIVQEFLNSLKTFESLLMEEKISDEQFNGFIESEIDRKGKKLSLFFEKEKKELDEILK